jgi:CubicO group peptidase (beta-lactamase class C family)
MDALRHAVEELVLAESFSGAIRVDRGTTTELVAAFGLADRAHGLRNEVGTRFGIASGAKGFTALTVMSLVADGTLALTTTARSLLGDDLPLVGGGVTVEHLLAHRSGIGDYLDEESAGDIRDYVLAVPAHALHGTEAYLAVLDGHPTRFRPGERFAYNNGGYVLLALLAERAAGSPFADLVAERVSRPAGLSSTGFLRSDELPGDAAVGYLDAVGPRTNVHHLPVLGSGDGGLSTTLDDVHRFWAALFDGRIVNGGRRDEMLRPRSDVPEEVKRYGMGFWLAAAGPAVLLEGYDAGVSFRSAHDPGRDVTWTVVSNTSDGAWPVARLLAEHLPFSGTE